MADRLSEQGLDFGALAPPDSVGMSPSGVRRVAEVFERQLAEGQHPGAQLVLLRYGQVVLEFSAGWADTRRERPVTPNTPFLTFSVTKSFTAMCVHRLIEEGKLEWDAPVARYWPEFGSHGKEAVTIRHVFMHQAGLPLRGLYSQMLFCQHWDWVVSRLASLSAEFPPGTQTAYHAISYGFILGELVRRVTGIPIEDYLRQVFLEPLGLENTWLGPPEDGRQRSAKIYPGCPDQRVVVWAFKMHFIRTAVIPAATLHSTARDLAVFYQMLLNGGEYAGRHYLQPDTVSAATSLGYEGWDRVIGRAMRWAHGFHLGGLHEIDPTIVDGMGKGSTSRTFGHFGQRTCMAWADWDAELVLTFTCNRLLSKERNLDRWRALSDAVWGAIQ